MQRFVDAADAAGVPSPLSLDAFSACLRAMLLEPAQPLSLQLTEQEPACVQAAGREADETCRKKEPGAVRTLGDAKAELEGLLQGLTVVWAAGKIERVQSCVRIFAVLAQLKSLTTLTNSSNYGMSDLPQA